MADKQAEWFINGKAIHLIIEAIKACPQVVKPEMGIEEFTDKLITSAKKLVDNNFVPVRD